MRPPEPTSAAQVEPSASPAPSRLDTLMENYQPHVETTESSGKGDRVASLSAAVSRQLAKLGKEPVKRH